MEYTEFDYKLRRFTILSFMKSYLEEKGEEGEDTLFEVTNNYFKSPLDEIIIKDIKSDYEKQLEDQN